MCTRTYAMYTKEQFTRKRSSFVLFVRSVRSSCISARVGVHAHIHTHNLHIYTHIIHIYINIHIYIDIRIYIYRYTHTHAHIDTHIYKYTRDPRARVWPASLRVCPARTYGFLHFMIYRTAFNGPQSVLKARRLIKEIIEDAK